VEPAFDAVLLAVRRDALGEREDGLFRHVLKDLCAARVAGEGVDEEEGLDFGDAGDDALDGDELAAVEALDLADSQRVP
jgi:hypothetical protein